MNAIKRGLAYTVLTAAWLFVAYRNGRRIFQTTQAYRKAMRGISEWRRDEAEM